MSTASHPGPALLDVLKTRWPFVAIALLLAVTVIGVMSVRWSGQSIRTPDAAPLLVRDLRFEDRADGAVVVIDTRTGQTVHVVTGEAGFVRGALRGLARERRRAGLGAELPFQLIGRADGRLTLLDLATGARIDLESFGPDNAREFTTLIFAGETLAATTNRP